MRLPGLVPWNRRLLGLAWQNPCLWIEDWMRQAGRAIPCRVWLAAAIFDERNTFPANFSYTWPLAYNYTRHAFLSLPTPTRQSIHSLLGYSLHQGNSLLSDLPYPWIYSLRDCPWLPSSPCPCPFASDVFRPYGFRFRLEGHLQNRSIRSWNGSVRSRYSRGLAERL